MGQKKHNDARDNFGTCCRVRSAARKNTRFIQSGAAKPAPGLCALEKNCDAESGRRTDGPEETPSTVAPWVRKKKNIIPETTLVATQVHVAESEARPEETHASFKAVLPNLRHGCALGETLRRRKRNRACNELQLLLRHRAVRKNTHAGEVRLRFETITCNELPRHAMNYSCCCAIVRSEKTHTLPNLNCSVVVVLVVAVVVV